MLRHTLGDACFWRAVQRYVNEHAQQAVETSDFRKALEAESGLNLTRFFDQWIFSKGYPRLKGDYDYSRDSGNRVRVGLTQQQQDDSAGVPLFAFPIEVEVTDDTGNKHLQTVVFDREAKQVAVFFLPEGTRPLRVRIDPEGKVLHTLEMNADEDLLENVAKDGEDVVSRIWAYGELIKIGTRGAINKVRDLIKGEKFWGVRVRGTYLIYFDSVCGFLSLAKHNPPNLIAISLTFSNPPIPTPVASALSNTRTALAIDLLVEIIDAETNPLAMASVLDAAQDLCDPAIRDAALRFLARENLPYRCEIFYRFCYRS